MCVFDLPDDLHLDISLGWQGGWGGGEGEILRGDEAAPSQAHHQPRVVHQNQIQLHRPHPARVNVYIEQCAVHPVRVKVYIEQCTAVW